jgi:hypothetical protein
MLLLSDEVLSLEEGNDGKTPKSFEVVIAVVWVCSTLAELDSVELAGKEVVEGIDFSRNRDSSSSAAKLMPMPRYLKNGCIYLLILLSNLS